MAKTDPHDERAQKKLQQLLLKAERAIADVKEHAEKHDLRFTILGIRRGFYEPCVGDPRWYDDDRLKDYTPDEIAKLKTRTDVLDISDKWVGSWC